MPKHLITLILIATTLLPGCATISTPPRTTNHRTIDPERLALTGVGLGTATAIAKLLEEAPAGALIRVGLLSWSGQPLSVEVWSYDTSNVLYTQYLVDLAVDDAQARRYSGFYTNDPYIAQHFLLISSIANNSPQRTQNSARSPEFDWPAIMRVGGGVFTAPTLHCIPNVSDLKYPPGAFNRALFYQLPDTPTPENIRDFMYDLGLGTQLPGEAFDEVHRDYLSWLEQTHGFDVSFELHRLRKAKERSELLWELPEDFTNEPTQ